MAAWRGYRDRVRVSVRGRLGTGVNMMAGLGVFGAAGYVFVAIAGYAFAGPDNAAEVGALTSFYLLMNIIGPGLFAALEPEISRTVSASIAVSEPVAPVLRRVLGLATAIFAGFAVVTAILWPILLSDVLAGRTAILVALLVGGAGTAAVFCVRGFLSGQRRFGAYALTYHLEGAFRLVPCVVLFVLAVEEPAWYCLAFAAGSAVAATAVVRSIRIGPAAVTENTQLGRMGRSLAFLVTATLLTQLVANLAPVVVTYRMPYDLVAASTFGVTYVLSRIPLMLFAPIQAVLLPQLSSAAATGRFEVLRTRMRQTLAVVAGLGIPAVLLSVLAGPSAIRLLFNATGTPGPWVFALLALSAVLVMAVLVLQPALVALGLQRTVTMAWAAGAGVYVALLVVPVDPIDAAVAAQLAGPVVVLIIAGTALMRALRR